MAKRKSVTMDDLYDKAREYSEFSCKPEAKFKRYNRGHIFDEEKSVRWNREEVERKNNEFEEEVKELNRKKNALGVELEKLIIKYIVQETDVTEERAKKIYRYLYGEYHSYGMMECLTHLDDLLEVFQ